MFLTTEKPVTAFDYVRDHGISCDQSAIEAELKYLADFEGNSVSVEAVGSFIILDGICRTSEDAERAIRVARNIAGFDRVISHVAIVSGYVKRVAVS